jgi:hypothetical protein
MITQQNRSRPKSKLKDSFERQGESNDGRESISHTASNLTNELVCSVISMVKARPATSLLLAIALGGITGWLVKQRK